MAGASDEQENTREEHDLPEAPELTRENSKTESAPETEVTADSEAAEAGSTEQDLADENATERKKRRFPVFWVLYAVFVASFCVALYFGVGYLTDILAEYESVQPEYTAEEIQDGSINIPTKPKKEHPKTETTDEE